MITRRITKAIGGRFSRFRVAGVVALGLVSWSHSAPVHAANPSAQAASPQTDPLELEVVRLQAALKRINAEVQELKAGPRNVRSDYFLRTRMADAEAVGRRLTEAESRLREHRSGNVRADAVRRPLGPEPVASPTDGPIELSAKADILLDQAQRLLNEADRLDRRATQIDRRDTLRRGLRRLERDPFIGMESQKRNLIFSARREEALSGSKSGDGISTGDTSSNTGAEGSGVTTTDMAADSRSETPTAAPPQAPTGGAAQNIAGAPASTNEPAPRTGPSAGISGDGAQTGGSTGADSVSFGFQTLINPETMAEVRRLEAIGTPASRAKAMQKAAQALREQSRLLESRAGTLRKSAR